MKFGYKRNDLVANFGYDIFTASGTPETVTIPRPEEHKGFPLGL